MPARAAALCTRLLPTGKTCAQPALRGEPFCRFHNDARSRWTAEHDEHMFALGDELDAMTIYQLLETLLDKLSNVTSVVRTYPDAKQTLVIAIDRLAQLTSEGFQITRIPSTPRPAFESPVQSAIESTTGPQLPQNQLPSVTPDLSMM
jgi:hypothetical protein